MPGGKAIWEEVTTPTTIAKGGQKSLTALKVNGRKALLVGKVLPSIAKKRGTY